MCCITDDPPLQVAAILELVREVADEIVVAYDERVDPSTLRPVREVADRLVRIRVEAPIEPYLDWLFSQCSKAWVLRIDGDEVPSEAFVELLGRLDDVPPHISHLVGSHRWVVGDGTEWLDEGPWHPDLHARLLRFGTARELRPLVVHSEGDVAGVGLHVEATIYHLDLALSDLATRREKVERYETSRRGLRSREGRALNVAIYLPELLDPAPSRAPVDAADRNRIAAVLAAAGATPSPGHSGAATDVPVVGPEVTLTRFAPLEDADRSAAVEITEAQLVLAPGRPHHVVVRVTNLGTATWFRRTDGGGVRLGAHWLGPDGAPVLPDAGRADLPVDIGPGETVLVRIEVPPPGPPGNYRLSVDLLEEGVRWFANPSVRDVVCPVEATIAVAHLGHALDETSLEVALTALTLAFPSQRVRLLDTSGATGARGLERVARRARRGRSRSGAHPALIEQLAPCSWLVLLRGAEPDKGSSRRSLVATLATARAARALGLVVVVAGPPLRHGGGFVDAYLARAVGRAVQASADDALSKRSDELDAHPAVRALRALREPPAGWLKA